jgi:hypothetical protein
MMKSPHNRRKVAFMTKLARHCSAATSLPFAADAQ